MQDIEAIPEDDDIYMNDDLADIVPETVYVEYIDDDQAFLDRCALQHALSSDDLVGDCEDTLERVVVTISTKLNKYSDDALADLKRLLEAYEVTTGLTTEQENAIRYLKSELEDLEDEYANLF